MKQRNEEIKKKLKLFTVGLLAVCMLTGCGSASYDTAAESPSYSYKGETAGAVANDGFMSDDVYDMADAATEEDVAYDDDSGYTVDAPTEAGGSGSGEDLDQTVASGRKLIKRVNMNVETQEFDALVSKIEQKVASLGGYMESSNVYGNGFSSERSRSANFTARVPVDKLDALVTYVGDTSNVTNKSETASDVTLEYVDTKSRKETLQVEQERLMALLEQADSIETIIALESRLTDIRYELQNLESRLRTYDNLVDYATVNISVDEVKVYTPVETQEKSAWKKMSEGFVKSAKDVAIGFVDFVVGLVIALPHLFVWAVIIAIIVLIIKAIIRGNKKKKEKKKLKAEQRAMEAVHGKANAGSGSAKPQNEEKPDPEKKEDQKKEQKKEQKDGQKKEQKDEQKEEQGKEEETKA